MPNFVVSTVNIDDLASLSSGTMMTMTVIGMVNKANLLHQAVNPLRLRDDIWQHITGSILAQIIAGEHQAITWLSVGLSSLISGGNRLRAISQEIPQPWITEFRLEITYLILYSNRPGSIRWCYESVARTWSICFHSINSSTKLVRGMFVKNDQLIGRKTLLTDYFCLRGHVIRCKATCWSWK